MAKALVLFSGGLDSILAIKLLQEQNINVTAFHFLNPFSDIKDKNYVKKIAKKLMVKLHIEKPTNAYLKIIKKPKYGYGKNLNPCIDCRIFILKKAKVYAKKIKAEIIATGEVLGERPMSQHLKALKIIERETKLERKILRPLSAKILEPTEYEKKRLIKRDLLLGIKGRSRKKQLELAKKYKIKDFLTPAGGCLLTNKEFCVKLKDHLEYEKKLSLKDIQVLKLGRHFRVGNSKLIVGRNKEENKALEKLKKRFMLIKPFVKGPTGLFKGNKKDIKKAAQIVLRYSDIENKKKEKIKINKKVFELKPLSKEKTDKYKLIKVSKRLGKC